MCRDRMKPMYRVIVHLRLRELMYVKPSKTILGLYCHAILTQLKKTKNRKLLNG